MKHRTIINLPWRFTTGQLAKRAGYTRHQMLRFIKSRPALQHLVKRGRWTRITLADLERAAPEFFRSLELRAKYGGEAA